MQLIDRYLTAVKFWLPKAQRADIAAELAANLQAEIDDRAAELGHAPTEADIAAILKQHGAPMLVASRYREEHRTVTIGRQLIGPVLFPFYWMAIQVTLVLLLIPGLVPAIFLGGHGSPAANLRDALIRIAHLSLPALVLVTLVFALIDLGLRKFHFIEKWGGDWDPRSLPSLDRQAKQVRRSRSIAGIIIQSLFIVWWWNHGSIPILVVTNDGAQVHFAPIVAALHLPILIIAIINLAQHWINLVEPNWRWLPPLTGVISSLAGLILLYPLLHTSPLISIFEPGGNPLGTREAAQIQSLLSLSMIYLWFGILVVGTIYLWRLIRLAWQTVPPGPPASTQNGPAAV